MSGYGERRAELARPRRWAPYAVMRREVLDLAAELLELGPGDVVVDLGCDLRAFSDAVAERRDPVRLISAFDIAGVPYPEPDDGGPPEALDVELLALDDWCFACPAKAFGTFVDEPAPELVERALSLLGEDTSVRWGRLVGALLAGRLCSGGRAVAVVHAGDLDIPRLAGARRRLVSSGLVERVLLLPLDAMVGRRVTTALLVLSRGNATVGVTDLGGLGLPSVARGRARGLSVADALALTGSGNPPLNRELRCCDLASGDCRLGAAALRSPHDEPSALRVGDLAEVFAGKNVSRAPAAGDAPGAASGGALMARAVGPGDFDHGDLAPTSSSRVPDKLVSVPGISEGKLLRRGDVVVPRASSSFAATVVEDDLDPATGLPLLATSNLVVIRPKDGVDPYYIAALVNSPVGVVTTLRGGPIRHTGVRDVSLLPVPEWHERRGEMQRIGEWYRGAVERVRQRRRELLVEEEGVAEGLESLAAPEPW